MTVVSLKPNSTPQLGSAAVHGAASAHAALADTDVNTYVQLLDGTTHTGIGFPTPSVPSGARILQATAVLELAGEYMNWSPFVDFDPSSLQDNLRAGTLTNNLVGVSSQSVTVNWQPNRTIFSFVSRDSAKLAGLSSWEIDLKNLGVSKSLFFPSGTTWSILAFSLSLVVAYVTKPTVTVTGPTGTLTNTSFPSTTWTATADPDSAPLSQAQVKIFNSTQYGAAGFNPSSSDAVVDSGVLSAGGADLETKWRTPTKLANATYRSYVRTKAANSNWSDWAYTQYTVNVIPPADPTSVTATAESAQGRIKIDVVGSDSPRSVDAVQIQRSLDGGVSWEDIRGFGADPYVGIAPVSAEVVAWDFEVPNGTPATYRARTLHAYLLGEWAASGWVTSAPASWSSNEWWVKHPTDWTRNRVVPIRGQASYTRAAQQGVFKVLGRAEPIVVSGGDRQLPAGEITFKLLDTAIQADVDALAGSDVPLLIQAPPSDAWPDRWVRLGDQTRERVVDGFSAPWMFDTYTWQEVTKPGGLYVSVPTGGPSHLTLPFTIDTTTTLH